MALGHRGNGPTGVGGNRGGRGGRALAIVCIVSALVIVAACVVAGVLLLGRGAESAAPKGDDTPTTFGDVPTEDEVDEGEAEVVADLLGGSTVSRRVGQAMQDIEGLAMDWLPPYLGWSDAIEVLYDGGEHDVDLISRLVCDTREIKQADWFSVDEIAEVASPLNARRLPLLIPSKPERTLHLEAGELAE